MTPAAVANNHSPDAFARVERIARFLDEAIPIPFTRWRMGLDPVLGLIPVVGDVAGLAIGSYLVWEAHRLGAPAALKFKMMRNVVVDAVAGLVPVLGDLVDFAYRSNKMNIELLRGHFRPLEPAARRREHWLKWAVRLALTAAVLGLLWWWRHRS